jgi:hypothetical protein
MRHVSEIINYLEEQIADFEMAVEQHHYVTKTDEIRYRMAQELLHFTLQTTHHIKYDAKVRDPSMQNIVSITHDTKAFGRHS